MEEAAQDPLREEAREAPQAPAPCACPICTAARFERELEEMAAGQRPGGAA